MKTGSRCWVHGCFHGRHQPGRAVSEQTPSVQNEFGSTPVSPEVRNDQSSLLLSFPLLGRSARLVGWFARPREQKKRVARREGFANIATTPSLMFDSGADPPRADSSTIFSLRFLEPLPTGSRQRAIRQVAVDDQGEREAGPVTYFPLCRSLRSDRTISEGPRTLYLAKVG